MVSVGMCASCCDPCALSSPALPSTLCQLPSFPSDDAAFGAQGWGKGASDKLMQVRGKDFRHEKTKKKRGGYRGGKIDSHGVNSIKFD